MLLQNHITLGLVAYVPVICKEIVLQPMMDRSRLCSLQDLGSLDPAEMEDVPICIVHEDRVNRLLFQVAQLDSIGSLPTFAGNPFPFCELFPNFRKFHSITDFPEWAFDFWRATLFMACPPAIVGELELVMFTSFTAFCR